MVKAQIGRFVVQKLGKSTRLHDLPVFRQVGEWVRRVMRLSVLADSHLARLVRRTERIVLWPDVRHKGFGRPFSRAEHLVEAGISLEDEATAANRQRPPEHRVMFEFLYGRSV